MLRHVPAGPARPTVAPGRAWFTEARFGLFVHVGLYSAAARHEWVLNNERQTAEHYARYAEVFDPDLFDARAIARAAKDAGMRYVVLTTKHHDGFALWDSAVSDYTIARTRGRDLVGELAEAVRAEALAPGLPPGVVLTQRADRLYLHLFAWPFAHVHLRGLADRVRYAQLLHDGSELRATRADPDQKAWNTTPGGQPPGTLTLHLPTARPDVAVPVVELFLR
ncbi:alpha-L-fucosidase [Promicromonospora sp. MEB111]|uniref:alpha-L-fucosidase n=1 Tax=Promicromonospora sp. MEB111 TaxID=3040301 RepID=UPI00254E9E10|nr:alpha-L-fucosidase [Promicromonospora sp. MEB111]